MLVCYVIYNNNKIFYYCTLMLDDNQRQYCTRGDLIPMALRHIKDYYK